MAKYPEVKDGLTRFLSNPNPNPNPNLTPNPNPNPNQVKDGLTRFLYEIILRRMEVTLPSYHPMLPLVITPSCAAWRRASPHVTPSHARTRYLVITPRPPRCGTSRAV